MTVGKLAGVMLKANLERQGVDLTFDDNLLHLDVAQRRIGVGTANTSLITERLLVNGNVKAVDLSTGECAYFIGNLAPCNVAAYTTNETVVSVAGTGAFKIPSGNIATRPTDPPAGSIRHRYILDANSQPTTNELEWYDGNVWISLTKEATTQTITANAAVQEYPLDNPDALPDSIMVMINGVVQEPGVSYDIVNGNIRFIDPTDLPVSSDRVLVKFLGATGPGTTVYGSLTTISNVGIPTSSTDIGTKGDIKFDANFLYICVETNRWIRSNIDNTF